MISDYGFAQIHPYILSGIHGNESDTSLRSLIGHLREVFLVQSKLVQLRYKFLPQVLLGPVIIRLNEPTQEMDNCSVRVSYSNFHLRFCKRSNNMLKFSQDSITLELTISSPFVHFLGQLVQQSHRWKLLKPI